MINELPYEELIKMKKDLDYGGKHLKHLVNLKIEEFKTKKRSVCATCGAPLGSHNMTLIFGPDDFKKKASFCAPDCLKYFLKKIEAKGGLIL
ncbi:hypothetical protein D6745_04190 [Candidatus Woesearchaeota archaeon]|nr:MAG: hypothetical protein D6745_04190 [Candidatus Woesearchaeota archaeon]